ncbi:MAG: hypothetical protein L3J63_05895 [Geopsychrobacter sp.]|nr:hypothetical protein [Geopsychrobacter sp.]
MFDDTDLDGMLDAFGAVTCPVKLNGGQVGTLRGIYRRNTEFVSPNEMEQLVIKPSLKCKTTDIDNYDQTHRIEVAGVDYKIWRKPVPSDSGFSLVALVKA